jgi:Protein of unknown function with PCYCGC motif
MEEQGRAIARSGESEKVMKKKSIRTSETGARIILWIGVAAVVGATIWAAPWSGQVARLMAAGAPAAARTAAPPKLGPHPQANLPPLELPKFQLSRSKDEVREIYHFAAVHPEVLSYIACFCGCERLGHKSNEDCFVKARDKNGNVTEWQDHGFMCPMCLSIGYDAMKMYEAGIPLARMRDDIDRTYGHTGFSTPTPMPPANAGAGK